MDKSRIFDRRCGQGERVFNWKIALTQVGGVMVENVDADLRAFIKPASDILPLSEQLLRVVSNKPCYVLDAKMVLLLATMVEDAGGRELQLPPTFGALVFMIPTFGTLHTKSQVPIKGSWIPIPLGKNLELGISPAGRAAVARLPDKGVNMLVEALLLYDTQPLSIVATPRRG